LPADGTTKVCSKQNVQRENGIENLMEIKVIPMYIKFICDLNAVSCDWWYSITTWLVDEEGCGNKDV